MNSSPILPNLASSQPPKEAGTIESKAKLARPNGQAANPAAAKSANTKSFADELAAGPKAAPSKPAPVAAPAQPKAEAKPEPVHKSFNDQNSVSEKPTGLSQQSAKPKETLAPATQTTAAQKAEVKENNPKQELVNAIRKIVGRDEQALRNHPVLALLTGHLEQLNPESIPGIVAESSFLQEAFTNGDIPKFLAEPMEAGKFLELLGVNVDAFKDRLPDTVDFSQMVTPIGVLRAINVDPQIVASELIALKDNMSMSDGLSNYMLRAAKMQATMGVAPQQPQLANPLANADQISVPDMAASQKIKSAKHKQLAEALGVAALPPDILIADEAERAANSSLAPTNPAMSSDPRGMSPAAAISPAAMLAPQPAGIQPTPRAMAPAANVAAPVNPNAPTMAAAPFDPYHAMIAKLSTVPTDKTSFDGDAAQTVSTLPRAQTLEEQLINSRMASNNSQTADMKAATITNLNAPIAPPITKITPADMKTEITPSKLEGKPGDLLQPLNTFGASNDLIANPTGNNEVKAMQDATPTEKATLTRVAALGSAERAFSSSQQQSQDLGSDSKNDQLNMNAAPLHQAKAGATATKAESSSFAETLADKTLSNMKQDIMNHSHMMLKNGGGSVTMDLSSKEHGNLEVALDMKNNNLDIKILTGSEHMRDLLQQELPKLRESLASQNLNLKGVEVGVGNGSAWQQGAQHGFNNSQNQQFQKSWQQIQAPRETRYALGKVVNNNWQIPAAANHRGQIQIWA